MLVNFERQQMGGEQLGTWVRQGEVLTLRSSIFLFFPYTTDFFFHHAERPGETMLPLLGSEGTQDRVQQER